MLICCHWEKKKTPDTEARKQISRSVPWVIPGLVRIVSFPMRTVTPPAPASQARISILAPTARVSKRCVGDLFGSQTWRPAEVLPLAMLTSRHSGPAGGAEVEEDEEEAEGGGASAPLAPARATATKHGLGSLHVRSLRDMLELDDLEDAMAKSFPASGGTPDAGRRTPDAGRGTRDAGRGSAPPSYL